MKKIPQKKKETKKAGTAAAKATWYCPTGEVSVEQLGFVKEHSEVFGINAIHRIRKLVFLQQLPEEQGAAHYKWDWEDGKIVACLTADKATLYIAAKKGLAPNSCCNYFEDLKHLEQIVFTGKAFDTSKSDDFHGMFRNCESLTSLQLGSFDTANAYDFARMFENCKSLKQLNLSSFKINSKVRFYKTFDERCNSVWHSAPTLVWDMFKNCESIETLDLSSFDVSNVNDFSGMFENCKSLRTLKVQEDFLSCVRCSKHEGTFDGCDRLLKNKKIR